MTVWFDAKPIGSFWRRPLGSVLLLMLLVLLAGCPKSQPTVQLLDRHFVVELAKDDASRTRGLMFRDALPEDHGMLFIFDDVQPRSFWMHNCKISLDILYFNDTLELVGQALSVPPCNLPPERCPNYPSGGAAKYVLELNAGTAEKMGVKLGDRLALNLD